MSANENFLDRLYQQGRAKAANAVAAKLGDRVTNLLAVAPDLTFTMFRLMLDGDVPVMRKAEFLLSVGYLFLPIDFVPDKFPILGKLDDLYVILSAVGKMLRTTDREILLRYWHGDVAALDKARDTLIKIDEKIGSGLTKSVLRYVEKATGGAIAAV